MVAGSDVADLLKNALEKATWKSSGWLLFLAAKKINKDRSVPDNLTDFLISLHIAI